MTHRPVNPWEDAPARPALLRSARLPLFGIALAAVLGVIAGVGLCLILTNALRGLIY